MSVAQEEAQQDWIEIRVAAALEAAPVAAAATTEIKSQLRGTMRERALRPPELAEVARNLIAAMKDFQVGKEK